MNEVRIPPWTWHSTYLCSCSPEFFLIIHIHPSPALYPPLVLTHHQTIPTTTHPHPPAQTYHNHHTFPSTPTPRLGALTLHVPCPRHPAPTRFTPSVRGPRVVLRVGRAWTVGVRMRVVVRNRYVRVRGMGVADDGAGSNVKRRARGGNVDGV
jgi:hypothetical protein